MPRKIAPKNPPSGPRLSEGITARPAREGTKKKPAAATLPVVAPSTTPLTEKNRSALREVMTTKQVEAYIGEAMSQLLTAMMDLAIGVTVVEYKFDREAGEVTERIYSQPPDFKALQFLIENGIGKVPNRLEMSGPNEGPIQITPWAPIAIAEEVNGSADTVDGEVRYLTDGEPPSESDE